MKPTIIGILGKPLSGKDTMAQALTEIDSGVAAISMGSILREVKSTGPSHRFWSMLNESAEVAASEGSAHTEPVFQCFTKLVDESIAEGKHTILWVAGPWNPKEVQLLDEWTKRRGFKEEFLYVDVENEEARRRLNMRKDDGRDDDKEEAFKVRLDTFSNNINVVVDQLRKEGRLIEISGMGDKETVSKRAIEVLNLHPRDPEITLPPMARR